MNADVIESISAEEAGCTIVAALDDMQRYAVKLDALAAGMNA